MDVFRNSIILSFATSTDLARIRCASRLFWDMFTQVETVAFRGSYYPWMPTMTCLRRLHLFRVDLTDATLFSLRAAYLSDFLLHACRRDVPLQDGILALATHSPAMTVFNLQGYTLLGGVATQLIHLWPSLQSLTLSGNGIDDRALDALALRSMKELRLYVSVPYNRVIDSYGVFTANTKLRSNIDVLNSAVCAFLARSHDTLTHLKLRLNLFYSCCPVTFGSYASLRRLNVCNAICIDDVELPRLVQHTPQLTEFIYNKPYFTTLEPFRNWRELEVFYVRGIDLADNLDIPGFEHVVRACPRIRVVDISGIMFGPNIPMLVATHCANLEEAVMTWSVNTACLVFLLSRCRQLKKLFITTSLTDMDFVILMEMHLEELCLSLCSAAEGLDTPPNLFKSFAEVYGPRLTVDETVCDYFEISDGDLSSHGVRVDDWIHKLNIYR